MSNLARLISQANARSLASMGEEAYVNESAAPDRYFTYPDVAIRLGVGGSDFPMSEAENALTGKLGYSGGTWPVNKTKKMFPRV